MIASRLADDIRPYKCLGIIFKKHIDFILKFDYNLLVNIKTTCFLRR